MKTSIRFQGLIIRLPGFIKSLDPLIDIVTIGVLGNFAANLATPVFPFCKNGELSFLDLVPSGKIPNELPDSKTSTALLKAFFPPFSLEVSI